jgi:hypothetical protein
MASMFIKHRVADYAKWKPVFDEHESARKNATITAHGLHRDVNDPNVVIIAFRATDLKRAQEFAASDELRSAMQRAGVMGPPEVWIADEVEDKRY